ncbi:MAG: hypothetical protein CMJ81_17345 [Planctomycetaceae bacterium]|nr:hypothetical protein [Planctomycetaceae bacterium]
MRAEHRTWDNSAWNAEWEAGATNMSHEPSFTNQQQQYDSLVDDEETLEDGKPVRPRERVKMPVGRHSKARGASKASWKNGKVSSSFSQLRGGFHRRRKRRFE